MASSRKTWRRIGGPGPTSYHESITLVITLVLIFSRSLCVSVQVYVQTVTEYAVGFGRHAWHRVTPPLYRKVGPPGIVGLFIQRIETGMILSQLATWLSLPGRTNHLHGMNPLPSAVGRVPSESRQNCLGDRFHYPRVLVRREAC